MQRINQKLSRQILKMVTEDQRLRKKAIRLKNLNSPEAKKLWKQIDAVDRKNTKVIKHIIKTYGWPKLSVFGEKLVRSVWLIVQHAVHDRNFQKKCLKLIKQNLKVGESLPRNYAYLYDRIRTREDKPQLFGTQFRGNKPFPMYDPKNLDKRRAKYGLEPFESYKRRLLKYYRYI